MMGLNALSASPDIVSGSKRKRRDNRSLIPQSVHAAKKSCTEVVSDGTHSIERESALDGLLDGARATGAVAALAALAVQPLRTG